MKTYHQSVIRVSEGVARFFNTVFTKITIDGPVLDAQELQQNPLMIVSTHRSHIDYFFAGKMMYFKGFRNLRFAAGDNLTKLPYIGPRFRNFGAFAVSRENGFKRSYIRNLCNDVIKMMDGGDIVLVFPEGGRSYTGSMLEIRGGILNSAILLQARNPHKDVRILPMSISYECAPDVPWFSLLLRGKKFRDRSNPALKRFLGSVYYFGADLLAFMPIFLYRIFRSNYGEIYSDYMEPLLVKDLIDIEGNKNCNAKDEFFAHRESLKLLSNKVYAHFISLYRILPMHLVAAALLFQKKGTIDLTILENRVKEVYSEAAQKGLNIKSVADLSADQMVAKGLQQLRRYKAVGKKANRYYIKKAEIVHYCASVLNVPQEVQPQ